MFVGREGSSLVVVFDVAILSPITQKYRHNNLILKVLNSMQQKTHQP